MQNVTSIPSAALQAISLNASEPLSWMGQLAKAVVVTDALQAAADQTLAKALTNEGQNSATFTALRLETAALDVWTAATTALVAKHRDMLRETVSNF